MDHHGAQLSADAFAVFVRIAGESRTEEGLGADSAADAALCPDRPQNLCGFLHQTAHGRLRLRAEIVLQYAELQRNDVDRLGIRGTSCGERRLKAALVIKSRQRIMLLGKILTLQ